jgi:hypothetical protein
MEKMNCRLALTAIYVVTALGIKGWIEAITPVMEVLKWRKRRDK